MVCQRLAVAKGPFVLLLYPYVVRLPHRPQRPHVTTFAVDQIDGLPASRHVAVLIPEFPVHRVDEVDGTGAAVHGDEAA